MHTLQQVSRSATVLLIALIFGASVPAFAQAQAGNEDSSSSSSSMSSSSSEVEVEHSSVTATSSSSATTSDDSTQTPQQKGDSLVANLKKLRGGKQKTPEQRQKTCEKHKKGVSEKFSHIVANSQKVQTRIDTIYGKALDYQKAKNLTPANFDSLAASADTAKANSAASVAALKGLSTSVDCSSATVANDVATFKAATQTARDNLKAYRTSVKAVLTALQTAKASTGGTQ